LPDKIVVVGTSAGGVEALNVEALNSVSSIRVREGWEATLYREPGFTGSSLVVTADKGYISNSMENRTSSIIVKSVLVPPITPPRPTTL
jgi:hypothetical protein